MSDQSKSNILNALPSWDFSNMSYSLIHRASNPWDRVRMYNLLALEIESVLNNLGCKKVKEDISDLVVFASRELCTYDFGIDLNENRYIPPIWHYYENIESEKIKFLAFASISGDCFKQGCPEIERLNKYDNARIIWTGNYNYSRTGITDAL